MPPRKPLIAISPDIVERKDVLEITGAQQTYIDALEKAGADCLILTTNLSVATRLLPTIDGLLCIGGFDIHPKHYRMRKTNDPFNLSPERRSKFELSFLRMYLQAGKPFLGICLGFQTFNVAMGGTIVQDLKTSRPKAKNHRKGMHPIDIIPKTKLHTILKNKRIKVNSRHHQELGELGQGLTVSAKSSDDVVEAIEIDNHPFALGLQWHPEELPKSIFSKRIFKAFSKACAKPY